jgi:hypothetical protein
MSLDITMRLSVVSALLYLVIIAAACAAVGGGPEFPSPEIRAEYEMLRSAYTYSPLCVGFPLTVSRLAGFYRAVLAHPDADRHFKELLLSGGLAGQLYALAGIYFTDPAFFQKAITPYLESSDKVITGVGDLFAETEVRSLAAKIQGGVIPKDLRDGRCPTYEEVMKNFEERGPEKAQEDLQEIFKRGY